MRPTRAAVATASVVALALPVVDAVAGPHHPSEELVADSDHVVGAFGSFGFSQRINGSADIDITQPISI